MCICPNYILFYIEIPKLILKELFSYDILLEKLKKTIPVRCFAIPIC